MVSGFAVPGEAISTTLTINGSPEVYTLLEERGDGGQGILYKAQRGDGQIVAIKILDRNPKLNEQERFAFWQKLDDVVGVTHLLAHGISSLELRKYAVVSDYVDGLNLEQLRARTPLSEEVVREILFQSATILGNIHAQNVLHRDIKPSNIMIDRSGAVYVTDFGAARNADVHTMTATMLGTPSYMAPEQDQKPSPRSDLYSLGLTVYFAMKGERPPLMPGLEYSRLLYLEELEEDFSPELLSLVKKMCAHEPEKRHQHAGEVLRDLEGRVDEIAVVDDNKIATLKDEIKMYEERVKSIRNFTLAGGAAVVGGTALAMLGAPYEATLAGIVAMYLGSFSALVGFATGVSYGFFYGPQRKKLQCLKERLQIEERTTTPVLVPEETSNAISDLETVIAHAPLVPEVVVLSAEDVQRKGYLEKEIASLETQIADFRWYKSALGFTHLSLDFLNIFSPGIAPVHTDADKAALSESVNHIKSPYHYYQAKKRLPKAKAELEILVEGNPEVRDLLVKKQDLDKPSKLKALFQYSPSLILIGTALTPLYKTFFILEEGTFYHRFYHIFIEDNMLDALFKTTLAAGYYGLMKIATTFENRREGKALDDKITVLRQPQLPAPPPERSYILMPLPSTYAEGVHALQEACIAEQNPLHPKYRLANGEEVYRSLNFKETFQAGVEDFWRLKDANGRTRTFDERVALLLTSRNSCTGMAYPINSEFFAIIPECKELIEIQRGFKDSFIPIEYASLRTRGIELDRRKATYNTLLTPEEIDTHEAWLTALQNDTRLLKAGREAVFAAYKQQYGRTLKKGMGFYLYNPFTQDELGVLSVSNQQGNSIAIGLNGLNNSGSFVRIAPHRNF